MAKSDTFPSAEPFVPKTASLAKMKTAADACRGCELYRNATQTVFGEGSKRARLMIVGEQPGNEEDLQGQPFVGPAGRLLHKILDGLKVPTESYYVTNAVKHFRWTPSGPSGARRLHQKPSARHVHACSPWLREEIKLIKPDIILCLGATAAQAVLGPKIRVTHDHGKRLQTEWAKAAFVALHPSAILRMKSPERQTAEAELKKDIQRAVQALAKISDSR